MHKFESLKPNLWVSEFNFECPTRIEVKSVLPYLCPALYCFLFFGLSKLVLKLHIFPFYYSNKSCTARFGCTAIPKVVVNYIFLYPKLANNLLPPIQLLTFLLPILDIEHQGQPRRKFKPFANDVIHVLPSPEV